MQSGSLIPQPPQQLRLRIALRRSRGTFNRARSWLARYGAALRVARFGNANEHADWETAHHVFTYANALDQLIKRIGSGCDSNATAVRGPHPAMALYLSRYLNVPPARIPGEGGDQLTTCVSVVR